MSLRDDILKEDLLIWSGSFKKKMLDWSYIVFHTCVDLLQNLMFLYSFLLAICCFNCLLLALHANVCVRVYVCTRVCACLVTRCGFVCCSVHVYSIKLLRLLSNRLIQVHSFEPVFGTTMLIEYYCISNIVFHLFTDLPRRHQEVRVFAG